MIEGRTVLAVLHRGHERLDPVQPFSQLGPRADELLHEAVSGHGAGDVLRLGDRAGELVDLRAEARREVDEGGDPLGARGAVPGRDVALEHGADGGPPTGQRARGTNQLCRRIELARHRRQQRRRR